MQVHLALCSLRLLILPFTSISWLKFKQAYVGASSLFFFYFRARHWQLVSDIHEILAVVVAPLLVVGRPTTTSGPTTSSGVFYVRSLASSPFSPWLADSSARPPNCAGIF